MLKSHGMIKLAPPHCASF